MIRKILTHIILPAIIAISCAIVVNSHLIKSSKEIKEEEVVEYAKGYIEKDIDGVCSRLIDYKITKLNSETYVVEVYFVLKNYGDYVKNEYIVVFGEYNYIREVEQ